ncbi:MAG: hypothetical protein ACR2PT_04310 [Endozoicomonas sp.]
MLTVKKLLPGLTALFTGLLAGSVTASADHYHQGSPGQHFVVLALVYEIFGGPESGSEEYQTYIGDGFIDSDGAILVSPKQASRVQDYLNKIGTNGQPLELSAYDTPVIKVFTRSRPGGVGYIRTLPHRIAERISNGSDTDIVTLPLANSAPITKLPAISIAEDRIKDSLPTLYRSKKHQITYKIQDSKKLAHLHFSYETGAPVCTELYCLRATGASFHPVMGKTAEGQFFLLGFTPYCIGHEYSCSIIRVHARPPEIPILPSVTSHLPPIMFTSPPVAFYPPPEISSSSAGTIETTPETSVESSAPLEVEIHQLPEGTEANEYRQKPGPLNFHSVTALISAALFLIVMYIIPNHD